MKKYFLGLSSTYSGKDTLRHLFATGSDFDLQELRAFLAAHYGATYDHVAVYANGRTALTVALKQIGQRGGKVVITSLTCYAVVQAVKAAGMVPIFADVDEKTLHFGGKELEEALKGETDVKAVIVQNNLGIPADITAIEEVAKKHKLQIIEDLAHCAGVKYRDGREVGTVGRAAILSFGKGKSIDTISGGAVIFTNPLDQPVEQPTATESKKETIRARFYPLFAATIRGLYRIHPKLGRGLTAVLVKIHWIKRSADGKINSKLRLTYWQCKLATRKLKSLPHRGRQPIRDFYLVKDQAGCVKELERRGFYFDEIWYNLPVCPERYFHKSGFREEECPVAAKLAKEIVNVPTWYPSAKMRPAVRIIRKYLINQDDITEEEVTETKEEFDKMSQAFRAAKDAEKRKFQIEEQKKAEKAKKIAAKKAKLEKKVAALDGAPDEEVVDDEAPNKKSAAKDKSKDKPKSKADKSKPLKSITKNLLKKPAKDVADLEQDSGLLDKVDATKENAATESDSNDSKNQKPLAGDAAGEEDVATASDSEGSLRRRAARIGSTPATAGGATGALRTDAERHSTSTQAVMRQAPRKLTAREKLKLELENGKKEGPSVI